MKKEMFEVMFYGRGGQGAKTSAHLLAEACVDQNKFVQAWPEFGPERRGAPIKAFARVSDEYIDTHEDVTSPDALVVLDETLVANITENVERAAIIVNSGKKPENIKAGFKSAGKICTVNATRISLDSIGKDIPNTPMLGALVKVTSIVSLDAIVKKIEDAFLEKIGEKATKANIEMVKRAYSEVRCND